MSEKFKAILITRDEEKRQSVAVAELTEADLMEGDVTVAVEATTWKPSLESTATATEPTPPAAPVTTTGPCFGVMPWRSSAIVQSMAV